MAAVTICSDFRAQEEESCHCFHFFPIYLPQSDGTGCHDFCIFILSSKPTFSISSFTFIKRLFSSSSLSVIKKKKRLSSTYLKLLIFLPAILIPAYNSSSLAFLMMCSAYKLNKQDDNKHCTTNSCTPFSILNYSVAPYWVLTVSSWPSYSFLGRQVSLSGIPISFLLHDPATVLQIPK